MDLLQVCLIGVILTYVWRIHSLSPVLGILQVTLIASLGALAFFLVDNDPRRTLSSTWGPIIAMLCIITALAVLSVPFALNPNRSFSFIREDLAKTFLIAVVLVASVRNIADVRRYVIALVVGGAIYALYAFAFIPMGSQGRLGDIIYHDANDLGMLLVCSLPLALIFVVRGKRVWARAAASLAMVLFILMIIRTGSRGAFLAMLAVAIYVLFSFDSVSRKMRTVAILSGTALLLLLGSAQYWGMIGTLLNPKEDYNWAGQSETGRLAVWKRGIDYMADRPLLGVGIDGFAVAEGTISPLAERAMYGRGVKWSAAHNSFIQIGAELGVAAMVVFVLLLVTGYRTARRIGHTRAVQGVLPEERVLGQALAASVVGFAIAGFFLSQAYGAFTFILLALIAGLAKVTGGTRPQRAPARPRTARIS